jgi:phosphoribosyl-AMP cyclohydrolase
MCETSLNLKIQFEKRGGLIPVVVQDIETLQILMLGYANKEALDETVSSGLATFWSTSRNELWTKGKTSGDYLSIKEILVDCDQDALIYKVKPEGGACHTKGKNKESRASCFYRKFNNQSQSLEFVSGLE